MATIAYNTKLVKKEDAPKGYDDLFDAKWKGSLSIDMEPERALMGWLMAWGEQRTRAFVEGLMKHGAIVRRGHTLQKKLFDNGLHIKATGDCVIIAPPLVAERSHVDMIVNMLRETLQKL